MRARRDRSRQRASPRRESPLIVPTGEPADWTDVSTVSPRFPSGSRARACSPIKRTIRFVWGSPPRAEDIDTVTRKRVPSPLVPAAYAEGCPDLSPDGKRLVYQGHAKDGRAFVFLSERPDGKDAAPVVATTEPSMSSEPTWLGEGEMFSYDVDHETRRRFFDRASQGRQSCRTWRRSQYVTLFRTSTEEAVLVSAVFDSGETEITSVSCRG